MDEEKCKKIIKGDIVQYKKNLDILTSTRGITHIVEPANKKTYESLKPFDAQDFVESLFITDDVE